MRSISFVILFFVSSSLFSQRNIIPTDTLYIRGNVQVEKKISLSQLDSFPKTDIHDLVLYNQKGEIKDTLKNIKGVSFKTILASTRLLYEKPKELNEFYFVLKGSDGYTVVMSWNEVYNTTQGDQFWIITELEGRKLNEIGERIQFIATGDLQAGRRYVRGLDQIKVKRED